MVDPRWQIAPDPFGWRALASAENSGRCSEGPGSKPPKDQFFLSRSFFSFFLKPVLLLTSCGYSQQHHVVN